MADNVTIDTLTGSPVCATDDDGTAHHQYVKVEFGGDGTFTKVTSSTGLPVSDAGGALTVDNDGTFAVQAAQSGNWTARIQDGSGNAITSAARGSERAVTVQIVDGSGNQITSFGGSGGTAETDDAAFTAGSGSGTPIMGYASTDAIDSGDVGVVAMTTARELKTAPVVSSTATRSQVADSATSGTLLAANTSRRGAIITNDSSAVLYVALGSGPATTTDYTTTIQPSGGTWTIPGGYTGIIVGIWASDPGDGGARVTELT